MEGNQVMKTAEEWFEAHNNYQAPTKVHSFIKS